MNGPSWFSSQRLSSAYLTLHIGLCYKGLRISPNKQRYFPLEIRPKRRGVPQGSVLGSILLELFIIDTDDSINSKILKFADDA